jgi:hypothetical protein
MRHFLHHIELWLSAAGVALTFLVPTLWSGAVFWRVAAFTAAGTAVLHGLIFWSVRRRQRETRQRAIADIRTMLQEELRDQFALITQIVRTADSERVRHHASRLDESMAHVGRMVDSLSEERLTNWKGRH